MHYMLNNMKTINKTISKTTELLEVTIKKHTINVITKIINYITKKISGQITFLLVVAMVMSNDHDGNYNTEAIDMHGNRKNDDIIEEENNSNQLSIVAWNIRCNNKKLPDVEKKAIKRQWDIIFISTTGLISSKIGPPTTESQLYLQDYASPWSSPTKSRLVKR